MRLSIQSDADIVSSRERGRAYARQSGLSTTEAIIVATVISELARNVLAHAGSGELVLAGVTEASRHGVRVTALNQGGNCLDHPEPLVRRLRALETRLDGPKQLIDEFEIVSDAGSGMIVALRKGTPNAERQCRAASTS